MNNQQTYHSLCRWTFNAGKGGFVPGGMRPSMNASTLSTEQVVSLIRDKIAPRLPEHIVLGYEVHYDTEVDADNAAALAGQLVDANMALAMITPGLHSHFGYGGPASLDASERSKANDLSQKTVDLTYSVLRKAWHSDAALAPSLVLWNGSYGYDLATPLVQDMYNHLKKSVADLCAYEASKGGELYFGIEPKPNEGHPAMLLPTVASAILFWLRLQSEYGVSLDKKGINKEFGHSEMIGLDAVYDTVEEIDNKMVTHMHLNSQGYGDGITLGGSGRYDIDHGFKINGTGVAIASLVSTAQYSRWYGHDMQMRPYDSEEQGIDRVIRSILSWDACQFAARGLDLSALQSAMLERKTALAEDVMRNAVVTAQQYFNELYNG